MELWVDSLTLPLDILRLSLRKVFSSLQHHNLRPLINKVLFFVRTSWVVIGAFRDGRTLRYRCPPAAYIFELFVVLLVFVWDTVDAILEFLKEDWDVLLVGKFRGELGAGGFSWCHFKGCECEPTSKAVTMSDTNRFKVQCSNFKPSLNATLTIFVACSN